MLADLKLVGIFMAPPILQQECWNNKGHLFWVPGILKLDHLYASTASALLMDHLFWGFSWLLPLQWECWHNKGTLCGFLDSEPRPSHSKRFLYLWTIPSALCCAFVFICLSNDTKHFLMCLFRLFVYLFPLEKCLCMSFGVWLLVRVLDMLWTQLLTGFATHVVVYPFYLIPCNFWSWCHLFLFCHICSGYYI